MISGFRAGFSFSAGVTDLVFSSTLPAAAKTWLIIPLGLASFALFYGVFRFMILKWKLKTPGREDEDALPAEAKAYVDFLEKEIETPIRLVSTGPGRHEMSYRK